MNEIIAEFLNDEVGCQDFYDSIYNFIADQNIRAGEYEGNIFVIKKMDRLNFIIFKEYVFRDSGLRTIHNSISLFRKDLLKAVNEHAATQGFTVKGYGEESNDVITSW
ncbi:hypothetical protein [Paenibacillus sp. R14(2021)]|uniref:hypothetical protein n=1 Tax=Paenibacillus sp. R14(2021) TaxID=2859228 RepID=UPI001C6146EF|nr:hypothetical protein [Paenibacillus sp. R14(2021)]